MPNAFSKQETVAFEDIMEGFTDSMVLSHNVSVYRPDSTLMQRSGDTIWRPQPYIATSIDAPPGTNISSLYKDMIQMSVPVTLGFSKAVPWTMDAKELRDALNEKRLGESAKQRLASDINVAMTTAACNQGTLFVKRAAVTGFDDIAECESVFNEQGVPDENRSIALSTRDYNGMASNLAARQTMGEIPTKAYRNAYVGMVASFDTFKLSYVNRKAAAAGTSITMSTQDAALNYYVPQATTSSVAGKINVDNRYQVITVSSTTNIAVGDAFRIANVNSVHHITKGDTGQPKTFRVMAINTGTTMTISPPIISNQVAAAASEKYQNCVVLSKSATAAITFLNTVANYVNPFWQKDALELVAGRYAFDESATILRATTDQGLEVVMQKFYDIHTMRTMYRVDTLFGVACKQPEMAGVMMFSQT